MTDARKAKRPSTPPAPTSPRIRDPGAVAGHVRGAGGKAKKPVNPLRSLKVKHGQAMAKERAARFAEECAAHGLPTPDTEVRFWPGRKHAFDFAWPALMVALESEGGAWSGGRHTRGAGFAKDCEKYNEAALRGWLLLRVLSSALCSAETLALVCRAVDRATPRPLPHSRPEAA